MIYTTRKQIDAMRSRVHLAFSFTSAATVVACIIERKRKSEVGQREIERERRFVTHPFGRMSE